MDCIVHGVTKSRTQLGDFTLLHFPGGSDSKGSAFNAGDLGLIPGSGGSPGKWNGSPLQYSCWDNPINKGAWWASIHGVAKSRT